MPKQPDRTRSHVVEVGPCHSEESGFFGFLNSFSLDCNLATTANDLVFVQILSKNLGPASHDAAHRDLEFSDSVFFVIVVIITVTIDNNKL